MVYYTQYHDERKGKKVKGYVYLEMQLDLDAVHAWCHDNQITLNQAITEYIYFSYRKKEIYSGSSFEIE